jgi:hypothetical protein
MITCVNPSAPHHPYARKIAQHPPSSGLIFETLRAGPVFLSQQGIRGNLMQRTAPKRGTRRWSRRVTRESDALDLKQRVFTWRDPKRIARSLKRSAERSRRRKGISYQSAMSTLNFYLNRAGRKLPTGRRSVLSRAKVELRRIFDR